MGSTQSKPPPCPLSRLSDCEVQLIMRCLCAFDLIRFARCSQQLMHAADSDFAWNETRESLLTVFAGSEDGLLIPSTRLLRHAGVMVDAGLQLCISVADLGSFCSQMRVRAITAKMSLHQWTAVLSLPSLQRIHTLDLQLEGFPSGAPPDPLTMMTRRRIVALPFGAAPWISLWSLLPTLPSLAELHITEPVVSRPDASPSSALNRCASLRHLHWSQPALNDGHLFRDTFTSESMRGLLSLDLCAFVATAYSPWGYPSIDDADFAAAFANLHSLHTLTLRYCYGVTALIVHLHLCRSLRNLVIHLCDFGSTLGPPAMVIPDALERLLAKLPELVCTIHFPRSRTAAPFLELFRKRNTLLALGPRFVIQLE